MAFIGILALAVVMWLIIILVVGVFVPSLIISIINLVQGCRRHWPKHNIILLSIFGTIVSLFLIAAFVLTLFMIISQAPEEINSASEEVSLLIKYWKL